MKGIIAIWSGAVVDIPYGWKLCDGSNGTPNLRDRFVVGAGGTSAPGATGGAANHVHGVNLGSHCHDLPSGNDIAEGASYAYVSTSSAVSGATDEAEGLPPYYALAYIMHI